MKERDSSNRERIGGTIRNVGIVVALIGLAVNFNLLVGGIALGGSGEILKRTGKSK